MYIITVIEVSMYQSSDRIKGLQCDTSDLPQGGVHFGLYRDMYSRHCGFRVFLPCVRTNAGAVAFSEVVPRLFNKCTDSFLFVDHPVLYGMCFELQPALLNDSIMR